MKPTKQPRSLQLADKFFEAYERRIQEGRVLPLTGVQRRLVLEVFEWACARYSCVAMTGRERMEERKVLNFQEYKLEKEKGDNKKEG